ncbi:MAG: DUF3987 domain-containing protein [Pseudomonadota bacterium]
MLSAPLSTWVARAAEAKSAPRDYVFAALLTTASTLIGNARWAMPWPGWEEPPALWTMLIGAPSSMKSPALDAVLGPLSGLAADLRRDGEAALTAWREKAALARIAETGWKEAVKAALKDDKAPPARPDMADPGPEPFPPQLRLGDITVERLAVILSRQPKGLLMARDELAGWLTGMNRYADGGTDRPFWLEAYGGRTYLVERMGRDPVHVDRLLVGVIGSIQPERLRSLLLKSEDDGLLARFLPVWPDPVPLRRPGQAADSALIETVLRRLDALGMIEDDTGGWRPWKVPLSEAARCILDELRSAAQDWETDADGLLMSFVGKLPGLVVRLSPILAYLEWAAGAGDEPREITQADLARAAHLVEVWVLPMARRAYAAGSLGAEERTALRLVARMACEPGPAGRGTMSRWLRAAGLAESLPQASEPRSGDPALAGPHRPSSARTKLTEPTKPMARTVPSVLSVLSGPAQAPDLDALTERAAIIEAEGGLARDAAEAAAAQAQGFAGRDALYAQVVAGWRSGLERLEARASDPRAALHIAAAVQFLDAGWGQRALGLGWAAEEIIGLSPRAPWDRFERMGIAWARHPTIALTETTATAIGGGLKGADNIIENIQEIF